MQKDIPEQDVTRLLARLKEQETSYPPELQQKRRDAFLALGVISPAAGIGAGKLAAETIHAAHLPMTTGMKLTLGFLSTMIVALSTYLGVTLYQNRDALRDYFRAGTPTSAWTSSSPGSFNTPLATPTFAYPGTPTATPTPTLTVATPIDGSIYQGTPTKPGLHLGQTKTPKPKQRNDR